MTRFIFFIGKLETLDYFTQQLCMACDIKGIEYYVADCNKPETYSSEILSTFISSGNAVLFTMNHIGIQLMTPDNQNYWDVHQIPVIDFIQDHPYNYDDILLNPPCNINAIVLDYNHERFIKKYYPKITNIHFMPNGGNSVPGMLDWNQRPIDILYVGNCNRQPSLIPISSLPDNGQLLYNTVINLLIEDPSSTIEDVMNIVLSQMYSVSDDITNTIIIDYAIVFSDWIRNYFKLKIMHTLEKTGKNIVIHGDHWTDNNEQWQENVHILPRISSEECNRLLGQAKIGLNIMPWYKNGCSERVFNVMLNGAVCLTDTSDYLLDRFCHGTNLVFYELNNMEMLLENANYILNNSNSASYIAKQGYDIASQNDDWFHRMETISLIADNL